MVKLLNEKESNAQKDLYDDLYSYADRYRMTSRWTESNVKKYLERQKKFRQMSDADFKKVVDKVNSDFKRKKKVKSSPYDENSYKKQESESVTMKLTMKESPVYGEEVTTVESPILQNLYTELQPLNRHKLCKVEMSTYVESIPGWGIKKTMTTVYPEILIRLRTDSPVTIEFTNSITIREVDGSPVAYYTTDSNHSSEVYSIDDVEDIIREIFDYDQSWARESVKRTKRRSMKESSEFNPQDYYDLLYDQKRPSPDMIQAYRDYLGPDLANSYEAERIGENNLGYCDCYCCKCGQYLSRTNCPTGWYHYVAELGDDEGHAWRDFCDDCWEEVSDMSADEILDTFEPAPFGEYIGDNYKTGSTNESYKKFNEDNYDLIKDDKKDKKTLDAYTAEIKNLKKKLSGCKDTKRKMFLQSTIAQYEKKAKEIEKFLKNTESVKRPRKKFRK